MELSVSQYLLARALDTVHLSERDVTLVNTSDADIVAAFGTGDVGAVVTWNPQVGEVMKSPLAEKVFDLQVPGEIIDMMGVKTAVLKDNPRLGMALTGAWYEVMGLDAASGPPMRPAKRPTSRWRPIWARTLPASTVS